MLPRVLGAGVVAVLWVVVHVIEWMDSQEYEEFTGSE